MMKIVPHLEVLERHHVARIGGASRSERGWVPDGVAHEVIDAARAIFKLGAYRATRLAPPKSGEVALVMPILHGAAGSNFDALNRLVAECAEAKTKKLTAAEANQRHLFVWMLPSMADAELAMAVLPPPPGHPYVAGRDRCRVGRHRTHQP